MKRFGWTAIVVGLLLAGKESRGDAKADDLAKFQGIWQLISAETDGEIAPWERVQQIRVTIKENTHTVTFGDQVIAQSIPFEIDPSKSPREVTDTVSNESGKATIIRGIYRLEGDTFVSCMAALDKTRPTEFTSPPKTGQTLRIFRRVKPGDSAKQPAIVAEQKKFEGTWRCASIDVEGKALSAEMFKQDRLLLKDSRFTLTEGPVTHRGVFSIDPTATPKTIDVVSTEGPGKGQTTLGIYTLEGDSYKICVGLRGSARPTAFESKPGSGTALEVLTRESR